MKITDFIQKLELVYSWFGNNGIKNVINEDIITPARNTGVLNGIRSEIKPIITFPKKLPVLKRLYISRA